MHKNTQDFCSLGIAPRILHDLDRMGIKVPTPIQYKAIPPSLEGNDVIGIAQTGTGKTLAFGIPIVQKLAREKGKALVLAPTRELAVQVDESFRKIARPCGLRSVVLIGGDSMNKQINALKSNPRIIVATPGRLIDHIENRKLKLTEVKVIVLDEADRMLDMGFAPQIEKILASCPKARQTMLFSATMPPLIVKIASKHMKLPVQVEIAPSGTAAEKVSQELFIVSKQAKVKLLSKILNQYRGPVLIFSRTKWGATKLNRAVKNMGYKCAEIHSDRTLGQRRNALEGFKSGAYRILVATDIAARGIDVTGIELVINYDLPDDPGNYVHRIGRTGRAGHEGHAISIATPDQRNLVKEIEGIMKVAIPISEHPEVSVERFAKPKTLFSSHRSRRRR